MGKNWIVRLGLLAMVAVVSGCLNQATGRTGAPARFVQPAEVERQLVGNTLYRQGWRGAAKFRFASAYNDDGTMTAKSWWFGGETKTTGRWWFNDEGLYCRAWDNRWSEGKEGCFSVSQSADDGRLIFDHVSGMPGSHRRYVYQVLAGNPHRL